MFVFFKRAVPLAAVLALGACSGMQLEQAQNLTPSGSAFQNSLYSGYVDLSSSEFREADYRDSDTFADRAISAGSGQTVEPEMIEARRLPENTVGELSSARGQLVTSLGAGAAERKPEDAAHAQVMFDCWMQEQEENIQPADIARCRAGFMEAMAKLMVAPKVAAAVPPPAPAPLPGPYVVFFDFDKAELTPESQAVLANVVRDAKKFGAGKLFTSGHADRAGENTYNDMLSKQRVDTVMSYLLASGIEKSKVLTSNYGENQPMVRTKDGQPEPKNRRVEINFTR